jgi:hypothetical protein
MSFDLSNIDLEQRAIAIGSALLIIAIGWALAGWAGSAVRKASERSRRVSPTLVPLFAKLTRLLLLLGSMPSTSCRPASPRSRASPSY